MKQFKLWIRFPPVGFQGNQGLCVCLCHQPAPLDCPELFCSKPAHAQPDQAEGESSSTALTGLFFLCSFPAGKSKSKEVSMTYSVCVCERAGHGRSWVSGCDTQNCSGFYLP